MENDCSIRVFRYDIVTPAIERNPGARDVSLTFTRHPRIVNFVYDK